MKTFYIMLPVVSAPCYMLTGPFYLFPIMIVSACITMYIFAVLNTTEATSDIIADEIQLQLADFILIS